MCIVVPIKAITDGISFCFSFSWNLVKTSVMKEMRIVFKSGNHISALHIQRSTHMLVCSLCIFRLVIMACHPSLPPFQRSLVWEWLLQWPQVCTVCTLLIAPLIWYALHSKTVAQDAQKQHNSLYSSWVGTEKMENRNRNLHKSWMCKIQLKTHSNPILFISQHPASLQKCT